MAPLPSPAPVDLHTWVDLTSIVVGATYGSARAMKRGLDVVGVATLAIVCGMGGGITRDLLLGVRPVAFTNDRFLLAALVTACVLVLLRPRHRGAHRQLLDGIDALMLAVFAVAGSSKALALGAPVVPAVVIGVASAVAGGVLADVLSGVTPRLFLDGPLYAIAAAGGALVFVTTAGHGVGFRQAAAVAIMVTFSLRIGSLARGWRVPMPPGLLPLLDERRATVTDGER